MLLTVNDETGCTSSVSSKLKCNWFKFEFAHHCRQWSLHDVAEKMQEPRATQRMRMRAVCRILSDQLPAGTRLPQLPAGRVITYATKNRDTHDDFYNSFSVCS